MALIKTLCSQAQLRLMRGSLTRPQGARPFSNKNDVQPPEGPVYELRMYSIKPEMFATYRQLMAEKFHLRLAYSMPLGYWIADLGGIFQAVHIWPYDSVGHRNLTRLALAADKDWQEGFFSKFLPCTLRMDNALLTLSGPPGTKPHTDFSPSPAAAYELLAIRSGGEEKFGGLAIPPPSDKEILVGRFRTIYGDVNMEWRLMRYPDADTAFAHSRTRAEENPSMFAFSRLMVPHECSPIK